MDKLARNKGVTIRFSGYFRKPEREPRYLDDEEIRRREEEQKRQVEEYKAFRDHVKAWREQDKQKRNLTKIRQLEQCEELQVSLLGPHLLHSLIPYQHI